MAYSTQRAVSNGTMVYLDLAIGYQSRADIKVFFNDLPAAPGSWAWVGTTDKRISFPVAVPNGVEVLVQRTTRLDRIINLFALGAKFNNTTMDMNFQQVLYLTQEAVEGSALSDIYNDVDFHGYKIKNLGLAVDDTDAITFGQLKGMNANALASANASAASAVASANSAASSAAARELAYAWAAQLTNPVNATEYSARQYALNSSSFANASQASAVSSAAAREESYQWATKLGSPVNATEYSSREYANRSATSAAAAQVAQSAAEGAAAPATAIYTRLNTVEGKADTAVSTANGAVTTANTAASDASAAVTNANGRVSKAGDTMTGNLVIAKASPGFALNKASSGQSATISGQRAGVNRWVISLGAGDTEAGSNLGSNFYLTRCRDDGVSLGDVMSIQRSTGLTSFANGLNVGGPVALSAGITMTEGTVNAYGYYARGYGVYMLQSVGAQNNGGGILANYVINCNAGLGLPMTQDATHIVGTKAYWQWVVSNTAFIMQDNGVGYSAGGWSATSDQRVKYDNILIENALDKVDQLTGYTYLRQDMAALDGTIPRKAGLIAQDVLKVLPETVNIPDNYDAEKNTGDLLSLSLDGVVGLLVNAVKELRAEVKDLRAQLNKE